MGDVWDIDGSRKDNSLGAAGSEGRECSDPVSKSVLAILSGSDIALQYNVSVQKL